MQIAGVRCGMERKNILQGNVVRVHTIAEWRGISETRNEDACESAQADVNDVVAWTAPATGPTGSIATEGSEAALLGVRNARNRQVDAHEIRHVHTE
jgi:hypothetical protein